MWGQWLQITSYRAWYDIYAIWLVHGEQKTVQSRLHPDILLPGFKHIHRRSSPEDHVTNPVFS
jgi:hypothetical protein